MIISAEKRNRRHQELLDGVREVMRQELAKKAAAEAEAKATAESHTEKETLYCSFCGKSQHEVKRLIVGPTAFICNECAYLCVGICMEVPTNGVVKP